MPGRGRARPATGWRPVAVALVVVLAGCGFAGPAGDERTRTATPAPVPTTTGRPAAPLPPGVTERGVADVAALTRAHVRAVVGTSYVWVDRRRTTFGSGPSRARVARRRVRLRNRTVPGTPVGTPRLDALR